MTDLYAHKIFIDGAEGTTGLRLKERLKSRRDIVLRVLSENDRRDPGRRREELNSCDIAFLCLPDDAAREAARMVENPRVRIIDASTAHRTAEGWDYGFPELSPEHFSACSSSLRITNPGCHACGFTALIYPLVKHGLLSSRAKLRCFSLTGYSGGGKPMIARYEDPERDESYGAPRQYALDQRHKHLSEMRAVCGLETCPVFCPVIFDRYSGMEVTVPLFGEELTEGASVKDVKEVFRKHYDGEIVNYRENIDDGGYLSATRLSGTDGMLITVAGDEERILLIAVFDNLGKGASGSAIECMNIMLGKKPSLGLTLL